MKYVRSAIAGILALSVVSAACGQQFLNVPDHTVIGRIGVGGSSGPSQAIPFANFFAASGFVTVPVISGHTAVFDGTTGKIKDSGLARLTANANYYVRRDGSDSNNGLANTAAGAWLTINKALTAISSSVDLAGYNVVVHVQGSGVGDGTYTENLLVPAYTGYGGNGFSQFIIQGENGTATITGSSATATVLAAIGGNASPIQFKNFTLANANASGIVVEADDGGFVALNTITFGSTGAGGILVEAVHSGGRVLLMAGTFTMSSGLSTGTGFLASRAGAIIFQPGSTINFAGATTFSNAVVDISNNAYFEDTGTTWSGTIPTGRSYVLNKNNGGLIVDTSLITGSVAASITPVAVGNGGTGQISWTSGGIPYANSSTTLASSGALAASALLLGGGAGNAPTNLASLGTTTTILHGNAAGAPTFGSVVAGDVTTNTLTNATLAQMAANTIKGNNTGGTANAADLTIAQVSALFTKPTVQLFTSGTDATYTTPANATWLEVEIVGGGGGGAGSGTTPGAALSGGNTCWNTSGTACTSPVYQAGGGTLGSAAGATSAAGGTVTGSGTCSDSQPGGAGGAAATTASSYGGIGGSSRFGGEGRPGWGGANNATAAATNSGSGGGGAGENATANAGGGGGAGAWCLFIQASPAATYKYTIGAAGTAGTAGTSGNAGAAGAAGKIRVIEHYN